MHDSSFEKSAIEGILGISFTSQNYVHILLSGEEAFQRIFDSISALNFISSRMTPKKPKNHMEGYRDLS